MTDILIRVWENLIGRLDGPIHFRFIMQPTIAAALAIRAGLRDAREGRPPFFSTFLKQPGRRRKLLLRGWNDIGQVLICAGVLDVIYQLVVHRGVYTLELLITIAVLAIVPYILVRGPANRIARAVNRGSHKNGRSLTTF